MHEYDVSRDIAYSHTMIVDIHPQAKQSTRFGGGRAYTSPKKAAYVKELTRQFKEQWPEDKAPIAGPVGLTVLYCFPWTKAQIKKGASGMAPTTKHIDIDNLLKPVKDALKQVCMEDDSQVVDVRARKVRFDSPAIIVRVDEWT